MTNLRGDGARSPGGTFFNSNHHAHADEAFLLNPSKSKPNVPEFKGTVNTIFTTVLHLLAMIALEVIMFLPKYVPPIYPNTERKPFRALATLHACLWLLLLLVGWQHAFSHRKSRVHGYLNFHRKSRFFRKAPFYIVSLGSMFLLVFSVVWEENDPKRLSALKVLFTTELALCIPVTVMYLLQVIKFNRKRDLPDVYRELMARVQIANSINDVDVSLPQDHDLDDVLEKQADIIRFMKQHNESLSRRIRALTEQLSSYEQGHRPNRHPLRT